MSPEWTSKLAWGDPEIGSLIATLPEFLQVHRIIGFSGAEKQRISSKIVELYNKGLSIRDISKQLGKATSTINSILRKAGIELRTSKTLPFKESRRASGKGTVRPPYGFCYFQGNVVPDQKEYENLLLIHNLWRQQLNPNAIASKLNAKQVPARSASSWNRNSIVLILKRFEESVISLRDGQLEIV